MSQEMPRDLAGWQALLADKKLPMLSRTRSALKSLMARPQLSITQYIDPILHDAGFCSEVFRHVNQQRKQAGRRPLASLENALSHFGTEGFASFLKQQQIFEDMQLEPRNQQGYLRLLAQITHATLQMREWSRQRKVLQPEEALLATLMAGVAEAHLWCFAGDTMSQIEQLCYVEGKNWNDAASSILGCELRQLGLSLSENMGLPEITQDAMAKQQDDFTLATGVLLARELCRVVDLNWYGGRAQAVIERIAKYQGKTAAEVERQLHLTAVEVNEEMQANGFASPARRIPMLADDAFVYEEFRLQSIETIAPDNTEAASSSLVAEKELSRSSVNQAAPREASPVKPAVANNKQTAQQKADMSLSAKSPKAKPAAPAENTKVAELKLSQPQKNTAAADGDSSQQVAGGESVSPGSNTEISRMIKQFNQLVAEARPAHDLIEFIVNHCHVIGIERCVFLVKHPSKHVLVTRYSHQPDDVDAIKPIKISTDKPNVFNLLIEKPRNLFLNDDNRGKYWKAVPDTVKLAIGVKSFFSISIFVKNHAMGILYADKLRGELNNNEFKQFQGVCKLLSRGIVQSAQNKHVSAAADA